MDYGLYDAEGCYFGASRKVTIPVGATDVEVDLKTNNDDLWESDEDAILAVVSARSIGDWVGDSGCSPRCEGYYLTGGGLFAPDPASPEASVTILDDDHWVIFLAESEEPGDPHTVIREEGETSAGITLSRVHEVMTPTRTGDKSYPIDVAFAYAGQAKAADYVMIHKAVKQPNGSTADVPHGGETPSFPIQEGNETETIQLKAKNDLYIERLFELLSITIADASREGESYGISPCDTVTVDIEDNDKPILRLVSYEDANPYYTDPEYIGDQFQFIYYKDSKITENHWHDMTGEEGVIDIPGEFGDKRYPVTYERSTGPDESEKSRFVLKARWDGCIEEGYAMKIEATGPDGMRVPETGVSELGGVIELGAVQSTGAAFPDTVKYYPNFTLDWTFKIGADTTARSAGQNSNEMYVTYLKPLDDKSRHTSFHLGSVPANGDGSLIEVVNDAWGAFVGLAVDRRDGGRMTYYGDPMSPPSSLKSLLQGRDGECTAWSVLFLDVLAAQGIDTEVKVFSATNNAEGMLVNNYSGFEQEGAFEKAGAVYGVAGVADYSNYTHLGRVVDPRIVAGDIVDQTGIVGQGPNSAPTSYFNFHAIVRMACDFDGDGETNYRYFGPSYGLEYASWAHQCSYLYSEEVYDSFAVDDFVSTALAGMYLRSRSATPFSAVINETITGDLNGDGDTQNPEIISEAILMREGDSSDIELTDPNDAF